MEIYTAVLVIMGLLILRIGVPVAILLLVGRFLAQKTNYPIPY